MKGGEGGTLFPFRTKEGGRGRRGKKVPSTPAASPGCFLSACRPGIPELQGSLGGDLALGKPLSTGARASPPGPGCRPLSPAGQPLSLPALNTQVSFLSHP